MGPLKRILYFLLSFLLTIQSQGVTFLMLSSAYADEFDKQRDDCINKKSKVWDPALNRCMTKAESFEDRQSFRECEKIKDDTAKQRQCFDDNAAEMIGSLEPKKAGLKEMQKTAEAMGYIQMILEMIAKDGANNSCMSSKVMAISGIVGMGVDIYLSFFVEDELHNLQDKYAKNITKKKQIEKGTYEAQIEAFNYLQKEQETLISVDEKKIICYGLMTGLNGIAMLLAIYEMTPFGAAGACTAAAPPGEGVDVPEAKVADVDGGKKPPDVEVPEGPEAPKGPEGPEVPGGEKKKRFKDVATDVKDKKKVIDAFPEKGPDVDTGGGKGKGRFAEVAGDVKTKKKVLSAFDDIPPTKKMVDLGPPPTPPGNPPSPPKKPNILDNPPGDFPPAPKSPGEPPKQPASLALGDPPKPPGKPDILNNPPGNVPPPPKDPGKPPKAPEPPGDPPRNPGDPGNAPSKPSAKAPKDPGDLPPAAPPGKPPPDPGPPPKDIDVGGRPEALAKAPEKPVPPIEPKKPAGGPGKAAGGGDYIEANIETTQMAKKDLVDMNDTDIDEMKVAKNQKDRLKKMRAEKEQNIKNIETQRRKYGKDHNVDNLLKRNKEIDKTSFDLQTKSQIQEIAGGRTKRGAVSPDMDNYNKQKAQFDADLDSYKQKKAEYDSYQNQKQRMGAETKQRAAIDDYKTKKADFDDYNQKKIDYENYKSQKAEFENYKQKKADYDSYSQKKRDFDDYAGESQSWKQKNQKYQGDLESFNSKQAKYDADLQKYNADYDTWQNQKSTLDAGSPEFDAAKAKYDDDLANYDADMDSWTRQKKKAELDRVNYNAKKAKHDTDMEAYQKDYDNWASKKSGNLEFENAKKQYDADLAKYDADMDAWTKEKKKYELARANYNMKKADLEAAAPEAPPKKTFVEAAEEVKTKKEVIDAFEKPPEVEVPLAPEQPKKSFKEAAGEVKTEKKVIDAFEKPPEEPVAPTPEKPKRSFKDVAGEVKEKKKVIDAFEKPPEPEPPKSSWESFKDGASKFWNWVKGTPLKGAKMGTKITHNKVMFYKGGKEVEYCDKDLEEDCQEEIVEEPGPAAPPQQERERSKVKENPDSSYRKVKDINFNDPNEILSAFINHKFEDKGLENIEDALILEKEWKSKVSGGIKSPSIVEYKKMQESGLFGKNPLLANIIYNIAISYRKINLANSLFPVAQAQDTTSPDTTPSSTSSGAVSDKPKNTFEEETDDEEDAANKKARQQQKGKDAGIMVGSAGAGMIGGALVSLGLDKFKDAVPKLGKVVEKVRVFFGTSPGIAVLAGMSTLINGLTLGFVVEEKKAFVENVEKIKEIKSKFEEDMAEHCPAKKDRETQSKPQCYCYISGGQRNPLRRNSDICKSYYARFDGSFYVGAGSYEFKADSPVRGCVGIKGNYDFDCSCRRYKDRASGSNACMKVNNSFEGIGNIGSSNSVGVLTTYGNDIASDPATIHRLDGEAVGRNAVKMKQASDQAMLAFNKQRAANGEKPFSVGAKELESFTNKVMSLPESRGAIAALQEAKTAPVRPPMAMPKDLKLKEEKKMDLSKITYESTAKKKEEKKEEAKAKAPDWDFLAEEKKDKEDVDFMGKSFDYDKGVKKKEIVEKEDTNIFNIISNRYINTGLKLLFKDDK